MTQAPSSVALPLMALVATLVAVTASAPQAAHGQDASDVRRVATEIHDRDAYADGLQVRQPDGTTTTFPPGADTESAGARHMDRGDGRDGVEERRVSDERRGTPPSTLPSFHLPSFDGTLLSQIMLALAGLVLLALVIAIAVSVLRRGAPVRSLSSADGPRPPPPPAEAMVLPWQAGDADTLFAKGRLGEAIVALLVQSLRASGWTPETERGRTAREVLWALSPEDPRRPPLSVILRGAERVRFAGEPPTEALYHELRGCRDHVLGAHAPGSSS